ncbi:hypothetical protein BREV_BREV_00236 [Brevundimonas mediterranea]|uniref:Uncharacterized protein n=1 Tax=Brevundimonas mediterranea TaxID=74329 RepID=A0A7Z8Y4F6_9CAUL|nr:hypothetical protein BREV_BREV_00236 [Brevundimonas mediterranea]
MQRMHYQNAHPLPLGVLTSNSYELPAQFGIIDAKNAAHEVDLHLSPVQLANEQGRVRRMIRAIGQN